MTNTTLLKLAPITKWCPVNDFPQGIIVLFYLGPNLVLGPRPCNLVKADRLGPYYILGPNHVTLTKAKRPGPRPDAHTPQTPLSLSPSFTTDWTLSHIYSSIYSLFLLVDYVSFRSFIFLQFLVSLFLKFLGSGSLCN